VGFNTNQPVSRKPPRERRCPNCKAVGLAKNLLLAGRLSSAFGAPGGCRRQCPQLQCRYVGLLAEFVEIRPCRPVLAGAAR